MFLRKKRLSLIDDFAGRFDRLLLLDELGLSRFGPFLCYAAPVATVRGTPGGLKLKDGFSTKITFARLPTIEFWEKTVQGPGYDGLEKIDQSTMHNLKFRTYAPRSLITVTDTTIKCAYDPILFSTAAGDVQNSINQADTITETFPDGSTLAYFGFMKSFIPDAHEEGKQPEGTLVISCTNVDSTGVEQAPVLVNVSGT